jgi:hypothetical protein
VSPCPTSFGAAVPFATMNRCSTGRVGGFSCGFFQLPASCLRELGGHDGEGGGEGGRRQSQAPGQPDQDSGEQETAALADDAGGTGGGAGQGALGSGEELGGQSAQRGPGAELPGVGHREGREQAGCPAGEEEEAERPGDAEGEERASDALAPQTVADDTRACQDRQGERAGSHQDEAGGGGGQVALGLHEVDDEHERLGEQAAERRRQADGDQTPAVRRPQERPPAAGQPPEAAAVKRELSGILRMKTTARRAGPAATYRRRHDR